MIQWCIDQWGSWDDKVLQAKPLRGVLFTRSFTGAGDEVCVCVGVTMGAFEPHVAPDKRELIIPDCTGCCQKEDFSVSLNYWPWTQQGTFISKPSPLFSPAPKSCSSAFMPRHYSQAALQSEPIILSDMMANMVGEMGSQGVGSSRHHRRTMWGLQHKYNSKHLIILWSLCSINLTQLFGVNWSEKCMVLILLPIKLALYINVAIYTIHNIYLINLSCVYDLISLHAVVDSLPQCHLWCTVSNCFVFCI